MGQEVTALIQSLIPLEWLAGAAVAIIGFAAIWFGGRKSAKADIKVNELEDRLFESLRAKEIENEVEALDRAALKSRARVWVRSQDR